MTDTGGKNAVAKTFEVLDGVELAVFAMAGHLREQDPEIVGPTIFGHFERGHQIRKPAKRIAR